jgi:tRNA dimethylallyltransferase
MLIASRALALVGTTASGKSALAHAVALAAGDIEICSVDSMQVYRGMDIGTAKATADERAEVRYHLLDLADPADEFTVAEFQRAAARAREEIEARGHRPLFVGGSALHLRVLIDELTIPARYPAVRAELEAESDTRVLHARLEELDPVGAARMEPTNRGRVVRALEVTVGSGRPFSSFGPGLDAHPPTDVDLVAVDLPRPVVGERIRRRYHEQVAAGFVDEVRHLLHRPEGLSRTARQALGYRQLIEHVEGRATLEDALDLAIRRTRQFAKRQQAWFRRDPRIRWLRTPENPHAVLGDLLRDWGGS